MTFSEETYLRRRRRVARELDARGWSALIVVDPSNLNYLTGYDAWSFYMPQMLLIEASSGADDAPDRALFVSREMDAKVAHRTARLEPEQVLAYPEALVHREDDHPFRWVAARLRERGWDAVFSQGPVGVETEVHFLHVRSYLELTGAFPGVEFVPARGLVNWQRLVKEPQEIDFLRRAGRISTHVLEVAADHVRAGLPQHLLAAALSAAQIEGVEGADGDYPALVPLIAAGAAADAPHLTWTATPLGNDETVSIEQAGVYRRYHAPSSRSFALGRVPAEVDRLAGVTIEALDAALDAVRPGAAARDVASAYSSVLARHGLSKASRLGYSIGLGYPPDWGEGTVSIRAEDETELLPDMTFHLIAGMWMDGFGCEFSESIRVAPDGLELLTHAPRRLLRR